jgi:hypothetical protein
MKRAKGSEEGVGGDIIMHPIIYYSGFARNVAMEIYQRFVKTQIPGILSSSWSF